MVSEMTVVAGGRKDTVVGAGEARSWNQLLRGKEGVGEKIWEGLELGED